MTKLIKIGNSMGVRLPKPIIMQAGLTGRSLKITVVDEGILLSPDNNPREGWAEAFSEMRTAGHDKMLFDDTAANDFNEDWQW